MNPKACPKPRWNSNQRRLYNVGNLGIRGRMKKVR